MPDTHGGELRLPDNIPDECFDDPAMWSGLSMPIEEYLAMEGDDDVE